jgi:hypothetical protein
MFAITEFSRNTQRVACMLMAACIVITSLSLGAYGVESVAHPGYLVTITQLQ